MPPIRWQERLLKMFDIRTSRYRPEDDNAKLEFWKRHDQVVASFHTLRMDERGRHERLLAAEPWDLVLVDEAHHLNADEHRGATLGHELIQKLQEHDRVTSMVFFTGTPHRGKHYGFLALLRLLRPDLFDPNKPTETQLPDLRQVLIRNNKYHVTDLSGQTLFQEPIVERQQYEHGEDERRFYDTLTRFISSGEAYSRSLGGTSESRAVMLVLIAMQKLASSSIAAIERAIRGRLARQAEKADRQSTLRSDRWRLIESDEARDEAGLDELALLDEEIASLEAELVLMEDERPRLEQLLELANEVQRETKIESLLDWCRKLPSTASVLFFTEYKATQSLLMSALMQEFGDGCATFINGDGVAHDVVARPGAASTSVREERAAAAERFNSGSVRFLVSTEAAGEGIDLQENCHRLVHVDLPWNPMRLHQRVGRLNRYGQRERVEVTVLYNPETVEARIWDKLTEKLQRINTALGSAMEHPEDLSQLVLGMTPSSVFTDLHVGAGTVSDDRFDDWFDQETASLGGDDVVEVARALVGNAAHFDFGEASASLPRVDIADLQPFLERMLRLSGRRITRESAGLAFLTPEAWRKDNRLLPPRYEGIRLERPAPHEGRADSAPCDIRHPILVAAIKQALEEPARVSVASHADGQFWCTAFRVRDDITTTGAVVSRTVVGVKGRPGASNFELLRDWELLRLLNELTERADAPAETTTPLRDDLGQRLEEASDFVLSRSASLELSFSRPALESLGAVIVLQS